MPCTTMVTVPAVASQSASVSGISSPSVVGSTRTNWPARAVRAITGARTVNSSIPRLRCALATITGNSAAVSV